jgi:hypothetical protein
MVLVSFGLWQKIQYLTWRSENPGVQFDPLPVIFRWMAPFTTVAKTGIGFGLMLLYCSGPLLFADFIGRKARQPSFKASRLALYGAVGVLELVCGLATTLMFVQAFMWEENSGKLTGAVFVTLLAVFPFWWFGANLCWYALREQRYLELGPPQDLQPEVFAAPTNANTSKMLVAVYRHRRALVGFLGLLLFGWIGRRVAGGNPWIVEFSGSFIWILLAVVLAGGMARTYWQSAKASRHFHLAGALLLGVCAFGSAADYARQGHFWSLGVIPLLAAAGFWRLFMTPRRASDPINEDDFKSGRDGHLGQFLFSAFALLWVNAKGGFLLGSQPANGWAVLALVLAPHAIHEYRRAHGQARQARAVILGALATVLIIGFPAPSLRFLLYGIPLVLALGLIYLKLQLQWEAQHHKQAGGARA